MDLNTPSTSSSSSSQDQTDSIFWLKLSSLHHNSSPSSKPAPITIPDRTSLYYPMTCTRSKRRGRCIILNYEIFTIFKDGGARWGTEKDVEQLVKTFDSLGFEVLPPYHNLTRQETKDILYFESKWNHKEYDCFVLCILTHGDENDIIYCTDGPLSTDLIFSLFTSDKCSTLVGKPKLFFIQACRGEKLDSGTLVHDSPTKSSKSNFVIPKYADFLIFYSTYPGFYAWRNTFIGSWFIQDLCYVLNSYSEMYDLLTMATLVCQKVAFTRESYNKDDREKHKKKQMPCFVSTLTRLVKFDKLLEEPTPETQSSELEIKSNSTKSTGPMKLVTTL